MDFESLLRLDPKIWPLAVLAWLRILSIFIWLPIFHTSTIPVRLKVMLSVLMALCLWPAIEPQIRVNTGHLQWSPIALFLLTMREVFFGFAVGFASRTINFGIEISSQLVGIGMGFQTASLFSPTAGHEESAYGSFKGWLVIVILLSLNLHHLFIEGIVRSFSTFIVSQEINAVAVSRGAVQVVTQSFDLALRFAAPLLCVQLLINATLGLLGRAVPQLNVFSVSFPVSFVLCMVVLFLTFSGFVRTLSGHAMRIEMGMFESMLRVVGK